MLMRDPPTCGALSEPNSANLSSCEVLSTARRWIQIPAKIPHYSNDCLGVGKTCACEIFANDAVLSGAFRAVDLGFAKDLDLSEEVREPVAMERFDSSDVG
jgi:hypothetical protein